MINSQVVEQSLSKQKMQIQIPEDTARLSVERQTALLEALAGVMKSPPHEIELDEISPEGVVFDVSIPSPAMQQMRAQLVANNAQLRLLGIERVILERPSGQVEAWVAQQGSYTLEATTSKQEPKKFEPVPGIWRFHVIYLVVTFVMGLAIFPYSQFLSLLLISVVCVVGIVLSLSRRLLAAHVLAVAIGLGAPVVVCAWLLPAQTVILLLTLITAAFVTRRILF